MQHTMRELEKYKDHVRGGYYSDDPNDILRLIPYATVFLLGTSFVIFRAGGTHIKLFLAPNRGVTPYEQSLMDENHKILRPYISKNLPPGVELNPIDASSRARPVYGTGPFTGRFLRHVKEEESEEDESERYDLAELQARIKFLEMKQERLRETYKIDIERRLHDLELAEQRKRDEERVAHLQELEEGDEMMETVVFGESDPEALEKYLARRETERRELEETEHRPRSDPRIRFDLSEDPHEVITTSKLGKIRGGEWKFDGRMINDAEGNPVFDTVFRIPREYDARAAGRKIYKRGA